MDELTPGFDSPLAAQACFRAILLAFSRPGRIVTLPGAVAPPAGLSPAAASVLLTLADAATGVALPEAAAARDWLAFHTGAPSVPVGEATFCATAARPGLADLRQGGDEAPEDGATLLLDVDDLEAGRVFLLSGPGLEAPMQATLPLDAGFAGEWHAQVLRAPCGVDLLLCAGARVIALPRSLTIEEV